MAGTGGPSAPPPEVEEERIGPYRLIRRLGQGGMGVVYLAEGNGRQQVALKVLHSAVAHDPTARARLEREAATLRKVSHPGVAGFLDHDLQGDRPYLVTRFVPGRPLDEQVDERGSLTAQRWLPVAGCLAEALQAIHAAGVVHRDLKPGNVMMHDGRPVLIDFGIAQATDDHRLTTTGLVIGTPGYLAPELIDGELVSESADWWGWAATVAFAATARRPFGKGPFEAVLHRVHAGQADLEGLDPRLKPLLAAALSPDRRDRPTSAEIIAGLSRYAEGRDALLPTAAAGRDPSTAVMTSVAPAPRAHPYDDPVAIARLVPPVIPPLSAFGPLRDRLRDGGGPGPEGAVPSHPATYSPTPGAAQPPAMPLPYQGPAPYPGAPYPAGPAPYTPGQNGRPPYQPVRQPLPPHLLPTRSGLLLALLLALVGLIALTPVIGSAVAVLLIVVARLIDRSSTALMRRRVVRGGRGRSDGFVAVAAGPVHLVTAALITLLCLILPLVAAITVGALTSAGFAVVRGLDWQPLSAVGFGAAALIGLLVAWSGPGGASLRRGARAGLRGAIRPAWLSTLVAAALLGAGVVTFLGAATGSGADWARAPIQTPDLPGRPGPGDLRDLRDLPLIRDLPILNR